MSDLELELWDEDNTTKIGDYKLVDSEGRQRNYRSLNSFGWKLNEPGSGEFVIDYDHPLAEDTKQGAVVRVTQGPAVMSTRIESTSEVLLSADESKLVKTVKCNGLLNDWADAVVGPWNMRRPNSLDRVFNWASPGLNRSSWGPVYSPEFSSRPYYPVAAPTPPIYAWWVWSEEDDPLNPTGAHDIGPSLFAQTFTLSSDERVCFFVSADDEFEVWLDGVLLVRDPTVFPDPSAWEDVRRYVVQVDAGEHLLCFRVTNLDWKGGLLYSAFTVDDATNTLDAPLFSSSEGAVGLSCLHTPSPFPGFTAPQILGILLGEAQGRGALDGWAINPVGVHAPIPEFACRVATSTMLDVVYALAEMHVDVSVDTAGLTLNVYPKGAMGSVKTVDVGDHLREWGAQEGGEYSNALLGVYEAGLVWRTSPESLGVRRRRETGVQLGQVSNAAAAGTVLASHIYGVSTPANSYFGDVLDAAGVEAGVDYTVGDKVNVVGSGQLMCVGVTKTVERNGRASSVVEWEHVVSFSQREQLRAARRLLEGHDAPASAPILGQDTMVLSGVPASEEVRWTWSEDIEDAVDPDDPERGWQPFRPKKTQRLYQFAAEIKYADLADVFPPPNDVTEIRLLKNGVELNALYRLRLTKTEWYVSVSIYGYETVMPGDVLTVQAVEFGGHVDGTITLGLADVP